MGSPDIIGFTTGAATGGLAVILLAGSATAVLKAEVQGDGVLVDVVDDHQPEGYESDGLMVDYTPRRLTFTCLPGEAAREAGLSNTEEETEPVSVSEPW